MSEGAKMPNEENEDDEESLILSMTFPVIALMLIDWGLIWLTAQFHVARSANYGKDAGALENLAIFFAVILNPLGIGLLIGQISRALRFPAWALFWILLVIAWVVMLTLTHGW